MPRIIKKQSALTLIELLVVIFVLGVGIMSVALLITKNLSLTKTIHIQNSATILAREGIELSYHVRNTNQILGYERNCAIRSKTECSQSLLSGSKSFTIDGRPTTNTQIQFNEITASNNFDTLFNASRLYLTTKTITPTQNKPMTITGYTHSPTGNQPSTFARYISFTGLNNIPSNSPIIANDIYHVSSIVFYKLTDNTTGSVILESFIANYD